MRGSPGPGGGYCPVLGELLANQANYPDNAVITTSPSQESVTEPIQISAKLRVRNFKCEDGCGGSVATRSITQQMAPLLWLVPTLSTLFTPHSAHIVTIPHFQTRSGLFILRVWIIRVPSHMLSSSPATNGYWVVSHWITTQYILLTSDIRPSLTLPAVIMVSDSLSYSYMKMFVFSL